MPDNIVTNTMLPVGAVLNGRYRIERYLSSGGFGNTYVATNEFGEQVAIKEFFIKGVNQRDSNNTTVSVSNSENRDQFTQQRDKFKKEAMRLRGLQSPHIVKVLSFFEENGTAYYVMNYIDGESLTQRLQRQGAMAENEVRDILNQMLEALDEVHNSQEPLFHLDIKPGNIMLDSRGVAYLIDFGASKQLDATTGGATASTQAAFTKGYAPLEQVEGRMDKIGPWTDFYALGATLYRLLTNQNPPQYSDIQDEGAAAFHFTATVSQPMCDLIQWMMQPQRTRRPQSVAEVRSRLPITQKQRKQTAPPQVPPQKDPDATIVNKQESTSSYNLGERINAKKLREWASDPKRSGKRFAIKRLGTTLYTTAELQGLSLYESDEIRLSTASTWKNLGLLVNNYTRVAPHVSKTGDRTGTTGRASTNSNTGGNNSGSSYGTGTSASDEQSNNSFMGWLIGIIIAGIVITLIATKGCEGTAEPVDDSYATEADTAAAYLSDSTAIYDAIQKGTFNGHAGCQWEDGWYYGNFKNGLPEGEGKFVSEKNSYQYEGNWHNGKKEGKGTETFNHVTNKDEMVGYEGDFKNGKRNGIGTAYFNDKTYQRGSWKNNELVSVTDEGTWEYK